MKISNHVERVCIYSFHLMQLFRRGCLHRRVFEQDLVCRPRLFFAHPTDTSLHERLNFRLHISTELCEYFALLLKSRKFKIMQLP